MVRLIKFSFLLLLFGFALPNQVTAQEPGQSVKPANEMSISEMMKECHKKPTQLLKKVAMGKADEAQKKRLVAIYTALKKASPPKGEAASWNAKTDLLISAATAAMENKSEASEMLTKAANCTACHDLHK